MLHDNDTPLPFEIAQSEDGLWRWKRRGVEEAWHGGYPTFAAALTAAMSGRG